MRASLLAVAVLALAACDSSGLDPVLPGPLPEPGVDTLGTVRIEPRATYLRTDTDPDATPTAAIALSSLGVQAGDVLTYYVTGYADLQSGAPTPARSRDLVGVFASSPTLGPSGDLQRVADAIDAGDDVATEPTALGGLATDIAEDFFATRATVAVPAGATHLFLALQDVYFSDNVDVGDGVRVTFLRRRP